MLGLFIERRDLCGLEASMEKLVTEPFFPPSCLNKCISPTQANILKCIFKKTSGKIKKGEFRAAVSF
jgi:hypothetical protein